MNLVKFYDIIDKELTDVIEKEEDINGKPEALLVWFLDFYGQIPLYKTYITDGSGDNSCDIIFSNVNGQGEKFFYVVQSKWRSLSTKTGETKSITKKEGDFGNTLTDFHAVLNGKISKRANENFNRKYGELREHLEKNGKVKFIFFTLATFNEELIPSIESFNQTWQPNVTLEVIGLQRLKRDYIERRYKEINTNNPLEYTYEAEESTIEVEIERSSDNNRDIFEYQDRSKSYVFLLRPKTIFELFDKFKFSLFYKNIRNPLPESNYNEKIVETLNTAPGDFWYFNNGISAITKVVPEIGHHAKNITMEGLQVINGAQTFYSVYQAYLKASPNTRKVMDSDARIMLKLIRSSNDDLNRKITKFTNSQNPLLDRDFFANDEIQIRLQNESFETDVWYEKRRGEFRNVKNVSENIRIVSNEAMIANYVAFHQQRPLSAFFGRDYFFKSRKDDANGLYEDIFNETIRYEDMLASHFIFGVIKKMFPKEKIFSKERYLYLLITSAFVKIILNKYFILKFKSEKKINLSLKILKEVKIIEEAKFGIKSILSKGIYFSMLTLKKKREKKGSLRELLTNPAFYETIKLEFEESHFTIEDIEDIEIQKQNT